ncbi:MAG: hypothetical protein GX890_03415 [Firmicutes bacterium]|jgi:hypothetical protein|nr:hypothetical protein [Bacillota bacterium]
MKDNIKISKRCRGHLHKKPNVVGVGVGYREKDGRITDEQAILVFVTKKVAPQKLNGSEMVPRSLRGQRVDVIEIGEVRLLEDQEEEESPLPGDSRLKRWRPAPGGVSVGHYKITAGTLGCAVKDPATGERFILSNNHVLANSSSGEDGRASVGDPVLQPGPYDGGRPEGDTIAPLARFIPLRPTMISPRCSMARRWESLANRLLTVLRPSYRLYLQKSNDEGNLVDAALAGPLDEAHLSPEIMGLGRISGIGEVYPGDEVVFSGRTSGVVRGRVIARDVSIMVTVEPGRELFFVDQLVTSAVSRPGDSGSVLLDGKNRAVGLLFAGSQTVSVCNRMQNVCTLLGVEPHLG